MPLTEHEFETGGGGWWERSSPVFRPGLGAPAHSRRDHNFDAASNWQNIFIYSLCMFSSGLASKSPEFI